MKEERHVIDSDDCHDYEVSDEPFWADHSFHDRGSNVEIREMPGGSALKIEKIASIHSMVQMRPAMNEFFLERFQNDSFIKLSKLSFNYGLFQCSFYFVVAMAAANIENKNITHNRLLMAR